MDAGKRPKNRACAQVRTRAPKRERRPGPRRSLNLSVCAEHHTRFKGLALLLGREPAELFMDWVEERAKGMRFSLPGAFSEGGEPEGEGGAETFPCRRQVG